MSDWKNSIPLIINKAKLQLFSSKNNDLEILFNKSQNINLIKKRDFEKSLRTVGIFLSTQEINCVFKNLNKDNLIKFDDFICWLRDSISERRLICIKDAFNHLNTKQNDKINIDELLNNLNCENHPRVRTRENTKEEIFNQIKNGLYNKSKDGTTLDEMDFLDYYVDVNACMPDEREGQFINTLESCYNFKSSTDKSHLKIVYYIFNELINKLNQKSSCKEDESITAYKYFKFYDIEDINALKFSDFNKALNNIGLTYKENEIFLLFKSMSDGSPKLFLTQISDYIKKTLVKDENKNPHYTNLTLNLNKLNKKIRDQLIEKCMFSFYFLKEKLFKNDENSLISRDNFVWRFKEYGVSLTNREYDTIFRLYDKSFNNQVNYIDFLREIAFSHYENNIETVKNLILEFYNLVKSKCPEVNYENYINYLNFKEFNEIKAGYKTKCQIENQLIEILKNKPFTEETYLDFYFNLSFYFDTIDSFRYFMEGHLSLRN